jgi:hypothetical protein
MTLTPLPGFKSLITHHCVTGSQQHIYTFYGYPIREEMLLGLGAGVGFIYWQMKGTLPFLGGRANVGRPGEEGMEKAAGRRTGVQVDIFRTNSSIKAEKALLDMLQAGKPVMLQLDMGFLPYLDFGGQEYHFGYHVVVACGYEPATQQVLLADRDEALHPVSLKALAQARGSKYKPFPPQHAWYTFDFSQAHPPRPTEITLSIRQCVSGMLAPPIRNLGVQGILKAAQAMPRWPAMLDEKALRDACLNACIMIDARGGTGGGLFRAMYGHFLGEAAVLTGQDGFREAGDQMLRISDHWQSVATWLERAYHAPDPAQAINEACAILTDIATQEEAVWKSLQQIVG